MGQAGMSRRRIDAGKKSGSGNMGVRLGDGLVEPGNFDDPAFPGGDF